MVYEPEVLFRSTAAYYARHRPGYPPGFFAHLDERLGLDDTQTVLDLGCGPGKVALPLAAMVSRVIGVDPEPNMLAEGRALALQQGIRNVQWIEADASQLSGLDLPSLNAVTMGASFHWMERDRVLRDLDSLVVPGGAVVVASGGGPGDATGFQPPPWTEVVAEIRTRYLGPERRAGSGTYSHPKERHDEVLRRSAFADVEVTSWTWELERDLDDVIGLQFSYSFSAPALFGDRKDAFEDDLRGALAAAFPSGRFVEPIRTECLVAKRPRSRSRSQRSDRA